MKDLTLNVKAEVFDKIESGVKSEVFREMSGYWKNRLTDSRTGRPKQFGNIVITCGQPKAGEKGKEITRPWNGFVNRFITHPEFDNKPTWVYAIKVN